MSSAVRPIVLPAALFSRRKKDTNKGDYGKILVIAGSDGMAGASILCARAALRAGAGLVTVATPSLIQPVVAGAVPEAMTLGLPHIQGVIDARMAWPKLKNWLASSGCDLILAGPGLGAGVELLLRRLLTAEKPLVLDADALNALAKISGWNRIAERGSIIITPHPGEAARLLGNSAAAVQKERVASVLRLAKLCGGVAVLKGHNSLVADAQGLCRVNGSGGPELAKGGSGDALAGIIAGLWAQAGCARGFRLSTALESASAGVFLHGLCGELAARELTDKCVLAGDLADFLPCAFQEARRRRR